MNLVGVAASLNGWSDLPQNDFLRKVVYYLIRLFDFDTERNAPTFFNALLLLLASVALFILGLYHDRRQDSGALKWKFLSLIFAFLSLDEIAVLHERLIGPVRSLLDVSGLLYFAWVIPYGIGLSLLVLAYFRFLMRLPRRTFNLIAAAGIIFVSGALGIELFSGWTYEAHGSENLGFRMLYTLEETMEMAGLIVFIYALLSYRDFSLEIATPRAS